MDKVRLFAALRVPPELQEPMMAPKRTFSGNWRWVKPDGLHITLVFLGDVPAGELTAITAALQPLGDLPPLSVTAGEVSGFPNARKARALVRQVPPEPALLALQQQTERQLAPWLGADRHPTYRPHVTLARHKFGAEVPAIVLPALDWKACEIALIESVRNSTGATYVDRATIPLGGGTCT